MLRWLQKRKNIATVMVAGVAILMMLWGVGGVLESRQRPGPAGTINGRSVPWEEYEHSRQATFLTMRLLYNVTLPPQFIEDEAWRRLLLLAEAKRRQLRVTDEEVVRRLHEIPWLQRQEAFAPDLYELFLRNRGFEARHFEEIFRDNLLIDQLQQAIRAEVTVPDERLREEFHNRHDRFRIGYVWLPFDDFKKAAEAAATEEQVVAYHTAHQAEFRIPDSRSIAYVLLPITELERSLAVSDAEVQAYYETHQAQFQTTETPKPTEAPKVKPLAEAKEEIVTLLKARKRNEALKAQRAQLEAWLDEGRSLEEIATLTNRPLQTTGLFAATDEVIPSVGREPAIRNEAWRLTVGETSEVVQAIQGLTILQVNAHQPAQDPPFEEVRSRARSGYVTQQARSLALQRAAEVREQDDLQQAAKTLKLKVQLPAPFRRDEPIETLGAAPALVTLLTGLKPLELTTPVPLEQGVVVAQLLERQSASDEEFAAAREALHRELLQRQQAIHVSEWLRSLERTAERTLVPTEPAP